MSYETIFDSIIQYFNTTFPSPTYIVQYDNAPSVDLEGEASWLRCSLLTGQSLQADVGANPTFRRIGILVIGIFVKIEKGDELATQLIDLVVNAFKPGSAGPGGGIIFRAPDVKNNGRDKRTGGIWWQHTVSMPFFKDET